MAKIRNSLLESEYRFETESETRIVTGVIANRNIEHSKASHFKAFDRSKVCANTYVKRRSIIILLQRIRVIFKSRQAVILNGTLKVMFFRF